MNTGHLTYLLALLLLLVLKVGSYPSLPMDGEDVKNIYQYQNAGERWLSVSRNTLWRRLKETGVTLEKYSTILCDDELDERLRVLRLRYPNCGQIMLHSMLSAQGIHIQRHRLRESIDPDRTYSRWRQYCLIRWCMVIHGCIDGFSRLVLYLQCENNNKMLQLFIAATEEYGLPSRVRSDKGGENFGVCEYMLRHRGTGRHCW